MFCSQVKKYTDLNELYSWARDMVMWYWSADTLFWQLSVDHNMNVQHQRCTSWSTYFWSMGTPLPFPPQSLYIVQLYPDVITKFSRLDELTTIRSVWHLVRRVRHTWFVQSDGHAPQPVVHGRGSMQVPLTTRELLQWCSDHWNPSVKAGEEPLPRGPAWTSVGLTEKEKAQITVMSLLWRSSHGGGWTLLPTGTSSKFMVRSLQPNVKTVLSSPDVREAKTKETRFNNRVVSVLYLILFWHV